VPLAVAHYRAHVGPEDAYDLMGATQFNLLTALGLRETHRLLDVGCGSLRAGRLLIPYLLPDRYFAVEPDREVVAEGIRHEVGEDLVRRKRPRFAYTTEFAFQEFGEVFDYAIAQSIFSHASLGQVRRCLHGLAAVTHRESVVVATFYAGADDHQGNEWTYPECVAYRPETMANVADEAGFEAAPLAWPHRHGQMWLLLLRSDRSGPPPAIAAEWDAARLEAEREATRYRIATLTDERDRAFALVEAMRRHPTRRAARAARRLLSRRVRRQGGS
jgi:SAM-dependent methyltransferase